MVVDLFEGVLDFLLEERGRVLPRYSMIDSLRILGVRCLKFAFAISELLTQIHLDFLCDFSVAGVEMSLIMEMLIGKKALRPRLVVEDMADLDGDSFTEFNFAFHSPGLAGDYLGHDSFHVWGSLPVCMNGSLASLVDVAVVRVMWLVLVSSCPT